MSPTLEEWTRRLEEARDSADALSIGLDAARDLEGEEARTVLERMEERQRFLEAERERYQYWMGRAGNVTTRIGLKRLGTALEKEFPGEDHAQWKRDFMHAAVHQVATLEAQEEEG